ncbi:efflux RND transporter periplasmic adaptor subunit [Paracoccus caeni]|uniref:efflux RND transporter periplasmic adaptor subunit n=1 Tax=Paracoccus caeni TaxID=657651 RepID=UPI001F282ECD|nr:efflux RND transporter periplasmic adaptor subunit [Paracoccus caeni]
MTAFIALPLFAAGALAQDGPLRVEIVEAQEQPVLVDLKLSGTIEARDSIELGFRQSGRVIEVMVDEGDEVAAGDPLARLDSVQQDQALRVAQASLDSARAAQAQAKQASDRAKALLARGVGTRAARDAAVQAESEANGAVERGESALDQARRAVEDTVLRAPQSAVVTACDLAPGQIVGAAQPAVSLASLDGLEAVFGAPDHPHLDAALGAKLQLQTLDIARPEMTGTIIEIAPLVDPQDGTVTLRVAIDDVRADTALLGAAVRGQVEIATDTGIAVPWTALMRDGAASAVWSVGDEDRVELVPVTISHFLNGLVFLSEGVQPGERIVGAGSQLMYPGRQVQKAETLP